MTRTLPRAESAFDAIQHITQAGLAAQELIEEVGRRIDRVVPSDGYFLGATDPETTLCIGAGVVHDLPYEICAPTWDYEFLVPDYLKFVDIADSGRPVADLHDATGGRPERSARWREIGTSTGLRAEVRVVFTIGDSIWGVGQLNRLGDSPRYSDDEKAWLERVAPVVATGLRQAMVAQPPSSPANRGPGIVVLDPDGQALSATREAAAWLDELDPALTGAAMSGFPLPFEAHAYASQIRASSADDGGSPVPRARLRTRTGVWLVMHGSMLQGTDDLALVIEPAKAGDVAPLIIEAYALTQREVEVTRAISRGLGTAEIAAHLFLSQHTVRDHIKSVFEKVGVSSRGELVAKVFADHYSPVMEHVEY
jgi:DNA-binding CsgD family transcriptional regulator